MARPTKYKKEFCDKLIEHMKQGYSFESFAGKIGVHRDTLYEWCKKNKKFSDAKKVATEAGLYAYETMVLSVATGQNITKKSVRKPNVTALVWFGKNVHGWSNKESVDHTSSDGSMTPVFNFIEHNNASD